MYNCKKMIQADQDTWCSLEEVMVWIHRIMLVLMLIFCYTHAQNLSINELMPANTTVLQDKDKAFNDWLEIFNADTHAIDMSDYYLSDDPQEKMKWQFPPLLLQPDSFIVVFASQKSSQIPARHYETVIDWGDEWHYFVGDTLGPSPDWYQTGFDDRNWASGPSGFGYGDDDDSTNIGPKGSFDQGPLSVFVRGTFTLQDTSTIKAVYLHMDYDDGFVAYLNGNEIIRRNVSGKPPTYDTPANESHEALMYRGRDPEEFIITDFIKYLRPGTNVLAIQGHNVDRYSSDMTLIPFLTLEMDQIPAEPRGGSDYLDFPSEVELHANFRLDAEGEYLLICDTSENIVDSVRYGPINADIAYGRKPDGTDNWYYFQTATPGGANVTEGYQQFAPQVLFSQRGGYFGQPITITLSADGVTGQIRYTTDGTKPDSESSLYVEPLYIDTTTVLRARVFIDGMLPGPTITHTFFMNTDFALPVVSLVTEPDHFFDWETGIYVYGPHADTLSYPYWGSNFWEDWERPVHIEFFEKDGFRAFGMDAGVQIFGSWSRLYPQKSLAIYARGRYGQDRMYYPLFPNRSLGAYKNIVLRNSGQDWGDTFFRDGLMSRLVNNTNLDYMGYRPVLVFLNGAFWGIHNMREKMNEHYLANHHGVDADNIDFIERDSMLIKGDLLAYRHLLDFVSHNDMSLQKNYDYVKTLMDVHNFMDYAISVMFYANSDWPWNNVKCWRPRTVNGRFKWLLFDNDYGFHGGHLSAISNMFDEIRRQSNGTTLLFFTLLQNKEYHRAFINRYADHLNTTFHPQRVTSMIESMKSHIMPEMPRHIERWKNTFEGPWWLGSSIDTMEEWHQAIQVAIEFALNRGNHVRRHIMDEFAISDGGTGRLQVNISPENAGTIEINHHIDVTEQWSGIYFREIPVKLFAQPRNGFRFDGWQNDIRTSQQSVTINISDTTNMVAVFTPDSTSGSVVINEINYNSAGDMDTEDWLELYNASHSDMDISGWALLDNDDSHTPFKIPQNTILPPDSSVVLCRDLQAFQRVFPDVPLCLGNFDFGFSSDGEGIRLFDRQGNLVDSVHFGVRSPWPAKPNGQGYTLELVNALKDNNNVENWQASTVRGGTPGAINSVATPVQQKESRQRYRYNLYPNYPNPFNPSTTIRFELLKGGPTKLIIYNLLGQKVKVLADGYYNSGRHTIQWNGKDRTGRPLPSGVYFLHLQSADYTETHKMVLVH
ncbi:MAG: T9SS type A sorting domain-containing protein [Caldithrix sp.]|nr:T9SS type A sorting domain-containing protein [Caldithrix sp.]